MNRSKITALCILPLILLCSCSNKEASSSVVTAEKGEMKVSPESIGFEWQKPYQDKLTEFRSSSLYEKGSGLGGSMFDLCDLDSDDIPELIISPSTNAEQGCEIFSVRDGKLITVGENGNNGCFSFYTETNAIDYEYDGGSFTMGEFRTISDKAVVPVLNYYNNAPSSLGGSAENPGYTSGITIRYELDSFEVTLPEYDEAIKQYTDQPHIKVGRRYTFSDDSISYALRCSESWGAVLSDERKEKCVKKLASLVNNYSTNAAFDICDLDGDKMPELIVSEGDSADAMCRIFYWKDKQLAETDYKIGSSGTICTDIKNNVFFSENDIDKNISASLEGGSLVESPSRSESIIGCGRRYPLCEDYIISALR